MFTLSRAPTCVVALLITYTYSYVKDSRVSSKNETVPPTAGRFALQTQWPQWPVPSWLKLRFLLFVDTY